MVLTIQFPTLHLTITVTGPWVRYSKHSYFGRGQTWMVGPFRVTKWQSAVSKALHVARNEPGKWPDYHNAVKKELEGKR